MGLVELRAPRAGYLLDVIDRILDKGVRIYGDTGWHPMRPDEHADGPSSVIVSHDENPTRWLAERRFMGQAFYEDTQHRVREDDAPR